MLSLVRRAALTAASAAVLVLPAAAPVAHAATGAVHGVNVGINAHESGNWAGYTRSGLTSKNKQFHQVSATWTVPFASQHRGGQAEHSSAWIGIGGGCLDANCFAVDNTLIQTGTESDVNADGSTSYHAWYELIPAPSLTIVNLTVHPGDFMYANIQETIANSNVWKITLKDVTTGQTFNKTVPYTSTHLTAEWIEETPIVFGTGGAGFAAMPNLTSPRFDNARVNKAPAALKLKEQIILVDTFSGGVVARPSAPDAQADGFDVCTYC